jgi:two-component system, chemotaxis family, sensor histidine kinase and response regulator PixL
MKELQPKQPSNFDQPRSWVDRANAERSVEGPTAIDVSQGLSAVDRADEDLSDLFIQELTALLETHDALEDEVISHGTNPDLADDGLSESFIKLLTTYIDQPALEMAMPPTDAAHIAPTLPISSPLTPTSVIAPNSSQSRDFDLPTAMTATTILPRSATDPASQSWKTKLADYYRSASVRVDVKRLSRLNNLVGELMTQENSVLLQSQHLQSTIHTVAQRFSRFTQSLRGLNKSIDHSLAQDAMAEIAQLGEAIQDMTLLDQRLHETYRQRQQTLKQVHSGLLQTQMLPLADITQRFPRMIRDLSLQHRKRVSLKLIGANTLMDKAILDKLMDPLVHLLRNAFDHGIEMPALREVNGKSSEATIEIRAYQRGNQTYIEVRDDGRGIDPELIRQKVVDRKLLAFDRAQALTKDELYEYIFSPGFSTATKVTELSGRGVGMDAVRAQVTQLKGSVSVKSEVTQGTIFTLRFPLTLTIANLLVFRINSLLFALPIDTLAGLVNIRHDQVQASNQQSWFAWEGTRVGIYPVAQLMRHYPMPLRPQPQLPNIPLPQEGDLTCLLIAGDHTTIGIPIDEVLQEQELVVKPFGQLIPPPSYLYGCTILGDGTLVPILDGQALIRRWKTIVRTPANERWLDEQASDRPAHRGDTPTILVVDDSPTARQFVALTLEKAGYQVIQARDGREALQYLQQSPSIQAVFCDVEMPRLNGFEFLAQCRQAPHTIDLPILMLTARSGENHQQKAKSLGATAYLTKPYLEQELLSTLADCLAHQSPGLAVHG